MPEPTGLLRPVQPFAAVLLPIPYRIEAFCNFCFTLRYGYGIIPVVTRWNTAVNRYGMVRSPNCPRGTDRRLTQKQERIDGINLCKPWTVEQL